ncbi:MAG: glycosyltransferase family 4 protein [Candidatus Nanopelagicales bacterium]
MPPSRPRVLMMVDNKVAGDARVLKSAQTVADLGYRVTVLGRRGPGAEDVATDDFRVRLVRVRRRRPPVEERTFVGSHRFAYPDDTHSAEVPTGPIAARWHTFRERRRAEAIDATIERAHRLAQSAPDTDPAALPSHDEYWQSLQPILVAYEDAYAPVIDKVRPHVIHAHDFRMIGIAVRAAQRAAAAGRRVPRVVYDAHEFLPGLEESREFLAGNIWYEASHIRRVDRIVTVSEPLADLLQEHHQLAVRPSVTLNAPEAAAREFDPTFGHDVRSDCGLADDVALLVYSGGVAPRRGLDIVIRGLADLPGVHLAVIANRDPLGRELIASTADESGVRDRVHVLDFVPRERIIQHLRTADVAVHPMIHLANHEIALPNKFFDYVFAGLPMVVSDVRHLEQVVVGSGLGRSFAARDPSAFADAAGGVLADLPRYRRAVADCPLRPEWTWESQQPVLAEIYNTLAPLRDGS